MLLLIISFSLRIREADGWWGRKRDKGEREDDEEERELTIRLPWRGNESTPLVSRSRGSGENGELES